MRQWNLNGTTLGAISVFAALSCPSCRTNSKVEQTASSVSDNASYSSISQIIPAADLAKIKGALPRVGYSTLQNVMNSNETLWYSHDVMTPSYQDSLGAQANSTWPNLVAANETVIGGLHDRRQKRWQFPFATTAGTDRSVSAKTVNFVHLPHTNGRPRSIPIWEVRRNYNRPQWNWIYPNGTMFGEIVFVAQGSDLVPSEIRIRTRYSSGWATNVFRPFPRAGDLATAIKLRRSNWSTAPNLKRLVDHLENPNTLTPKTLAAVGSSTMRATFQQSGSLDVLPDFEDPALVRELLTTTTFVSAYGDAWKESGSQKTFAAASGSGVSIVPDNYEAGLIEVNETSCMRCHKEGGRLVSEFYDDLYLYGEMWGKDGIFSFHPFDESRYPQLRAGGDNRSINPKLRTMGVFEPYDTAKHNQTWYPPRPN